MLTLQNLLTVTAVLAACIGLRALLHKFARCAAVLWVWYVAAAWLVLNALPGQLFCAASLWGLSAGGPQPSLPPLVINAVKHGVAAESSTLLLALPGLVWLVGAVAVGVWLVRDRIKDRRKTAALLRCAAPQTSVLPLSSRVRLLQNELVASPVSVGWRRPVILGPLEFGDLSTQQQKMVLVHEKTHIHRHDPLLKALLLVLTALYWYHPLVWLMRSQVLLDMEYRCDEAVLDTCGADCRYAYAQLLQQFAAGELMAGGMAFAMSAGRMLQLRFQRMLRYRRPVPQHSIAALVLTLALAALLGTAAPAAAVQAAPPAQHGQVAVQTRPLTAGWTGWHVIPQGQALVYTGGGDVWRLAQNDTAQLTLTLAQGGMQDVTLGYLDMDLQKYVIVYSGPTQNYLRLHWQAPYDGRFAFFVYADQAGPARVQSFAVKVP